MAREDLLSAFDLKIHSNTDWVAKLAVLGYIAAATVDYCCLDTLGLGSSGHESSPTGRLASFLSAEPCSRIYLEELESV